MKKLIFIFASLVILFLFAGLVRAEEKCPDPELAGGWGRTSDDSGGVTGNWYSWTIGNGSTGIWNTLGTITNDCTKIVYNCEYEPDSPVSGPNPPNVGSGYKGFNDGHGVHWFWDEGNAVGTSQAAGYSYIWITLNYIEASKVYRANLSIRWYAWTDDFDGDKAYTYLAVQMQKPGFSSWDNIWVQSYTAGTRNTGWQTSTVDIKSYLTTSGNYKLRLFCYCYHDADESSGDDEHFAWWVDYVHVDVCEDFDSPTVTLVSGPTGWVNSTSVSFYWSAQDTGGSGLASSAFSYRLDNGTWSSWTSSTSYTWSGLTEGNHTFSVKARDAVGNESSVVSRTFGVDYTAPTVSKSSGPDNGKWYNSASQTFCWSGSDSLSGINRYEYRISTDDGSTWSSWASLGTNTAWTWSNLSSSTNYYRVQVRAVDNAGNISAVVEWKFRIDTIAPSLGKSSGPDGGNWYNSTSQTFSWSGSDSHSGISTYYYRYSTDGGSTWSTWTSTTSTSYTWSNLFSSTNLYKFQVYAKDAAGNSSSIIEWVFRIDNLPPSISKSSGPVEEGWCNSSSQTFKWSGSDSHSGISKYEYRTSTDDGMNWSSWSSIGTSNSWTWSGLRSSADYYRLQVRAVDAAGNVSSPIEWRFRIDCTPPSNPLSCSDLDGSQDNIWQNSIIDPHFTWSGHSDSHSGIAGFYVYWGTNPDGTSTTWVVSPEYDPPAVSSDGAYYLRVQTVDVAGNRSPWATLYVFKLDKTAPSISKSSGPDRGVWVKASSVSFSWSASDAGSGLHSSPYSYRLDNGPWSQWTTVSSFTISDLADGIHTFSVKARDFAGNESQAVIWDFGVDTKPPQIKKNGGPDEWRWVNTTMVSFSWLAYDNGSGLDSVCYRLDNGPWSEWSSITSYTWADLTNGLHTFSLKARDIAGNESLVETWVFQVDTESPHLVKISGPDEEIQTSFATFEWSASDSFSGVSRYFYRTSTDGGMSWSSWTETTFTTWTWQNLTSSSSTYVFEVCAQDKAGNRSQPVTWKFRVTLPPSAPSLEIQPANFKIKKGHDLSLTAILTLDGKPLKGKVIKWTATAGTLIPPVTTTDSFGKATVSYTAPSDLESVTITASFEGDRQLTSAIAKSTGIVTSDAIVITLVKTDGTPLAFTRIFYRTETGKGYLGTTDSQGRVTVDIDSFNSSEIFLETEDGEFAATCSLQEGDQRIVFKPKVLTTSEMEESNRSVALLLSTTLVGTAGAVITAWKILGRHRPRVSVSETRAYVPVYCPKCKAVNLPGNRFCGRCGAPLQKVKLNKT
jgi:hypothetical protein